MQNLNDKKEELDIKLKELYSLEIKYNNELDEIDKECFERKEPIENILNIQKNIQDLNKSNLINKLNSFSKDEIELLKSNGMDLCGILNKINVCDDLSICNKCNNKGSKLHSCPYKAEINNDSDSLCNCCRNCKNDCKMDI